MWLELMFGSVCRHGILVYVICASLVYLLFPTLSPFSSIMKFASLQEYLPNFETPTKQYVGFANMYSRH